jgi:hypothetical protein
MMAGLACARRWMATDDLDTLRRFGRLSDMRPEHLDVYIDRFRTCCDLCPPGSAHLGAGPDCLIATPSGELGIEVTRIPREPEEVRKCRELIERHGDILINRAERLYETEGGPPVTVLVAADAQLPVPERNIEEVANWLAGQVSTAEMVPGHGLFLRRPVRPGSRWPDGIAAITVMRNRSAAASRWSLASDVQPSPLRTEDIQHALDAKDAGFDGYRRCSNGVWLLAVVDGDDDGERDSACIDGGDRAPTPTLAAIPPVVARHPYRSSYDRVFLLDYPHARARPLIVEPPGQSR